VYAFAVDVRGRIQFDLNIVAAKDRLLLDVDREALPAALAHMDRYLLSEKVTLKDVSADFARLGVVGPRAADVAMKLGVGGLAALPALSLQTLPDDVCLIRSDFTGLLGFELMVPTARAGAWWDRLVQEHQLRPVGHAVVNVLRIEAGLPWPGAELTSQVLPAETGQIERAVSFNKGCYLGQEVVERMRSRDSLARRLVKVRTPSCAAVSLPLALLQNGAEVGRITSLQKHPVREECVGLAYVRTTVAESRLNLAGEKGTADVEIVPLA
jgi:folate-binding protein YgfZ